MKFDVQTKDFPESFYVFIEIPQGGNTKLDHEPSKTASAISVTERPIFRCMYSNNTRIPKIIVPSDYLP